MVYVKGCNARQIRMFQRQHDEHRAARIGKSCEITAKHGHVKCLKLACMLGGDIGRSCEIAVRNDHFRCFLIAKDHGLGKHRKSP